MKSNDKGDKQESGFLFPSGWRRDSARRLSLRSTGPSIRRDLSPRSATGAGHTKQAAVWWPSEGE